MISGRPSVLCFALLAAVVAITTAPVFGQAFYGSVVGTITDQSGGALAGATVTLTNVATSERRQEQSQPFKLFRVEYSIK